MKKFVKMATALVVAVAVVISPLKEARASMFGEENIVLAQILAQAIKQLYELQKILQSGEDTLNLMRDLNRGINDSLKALESLGPNIDPGTYKALKGVEDIVAVLHQDYGNVSDTPDKTAQTDTDQVVAEAINLNNALYDYAKDLDAVGEKIKMFSHEVSPGGAQKLTAQSMGVMVHLMNQQIRAQATGLKLQAQGLAMQNRRDKASTNEYLREAQTLQTAMRSKQVNFEFPRF